MRRTVTQAVRARKVACTAGISVGEGSRKSAKKENGDRSLFPFARGPVKKRAKALCFAGLTAEKWGREPFSRRGRQPRRLWSRGLSCRRRRFASRSGSGLFRSIGGKLPFSRPSSCPGRTRDQGLSP